LAFLISDRMVFLTGSAFLSHHLMSIQGSCREGGTQEPIEFHRILLDLPEGALGLRLRAVGCGSVYDGNMTLLFPVRQKFSALGCERQGICIQGQFPAQKGLLLRGNVQQSMQHSPSQTAVGVALGFGCLQDGIPAACLCGCLSKPGGHAFPIIRKQNLFLPSAKVGEKHPQGLRIDNVMVQERIPHGFRQAFFRFVGGKPGCAGFFPQMGPYCGGGDAARLSFQDLKLSGIAFLSQGFEVFQTQRGIGGGQDGCSDLCFLRMAGGNRLLQGSGVGETLREGFSEGFACARIIQKGLHGQEFLLVLHRGSEDHRVRAQPGQKSHGSSGEILRRLQTVEGRVEQHRIAAHISCSLRPDPGIHKRRFSSLHEGAGQDADRGGSRLLRKAKMAQMPRVKWVIFTQKSGEIHHI